MNLDRLGRRCARVTVVASVLCALLTSAARAADPADAEALIREGVTLRRAGNDVRALPLFQRAYEIAHTPRTAAQLGLVEFALGYSLDAERHLSQGLAVPTDSWIAKNRAILDEALTSVKTTIGELMITGSPDGADVIVNGRPAGRLPIAAPVRVGQGPALVELRAEGYAPNSASVDVVGGKKGSLDLHLQARVGMSLPVALSQPQSEKTIALDSPSDKPAVRSDGQTGRTILGWTLVGTGAAAAILGGVFVLRPTATCDPMPGFECTTAPAKHTAGWVLLGAGAAVAVGGGIVLLTRPSAHVEVGLGPTAIFFRSRL
jgi:hypothetical protein